MRFVFIIILSLAFISLSAQSKKDLEAQVKNLEAKTKALEAEIEQLKKSKEVNMSDKNEKAGYSVGVLMANNIKTQGGDSLDMEAMIIGIKDVYAKSLKMEQQQCMTFVKQYFQQVSEQKNFEVKEEGKAFLENNKKNEGVVVTTSGLQYKVITQGNGKIPTMSDKVTVHYTGKLIDGSIFDSSVQRGEPANFSLTQVIRGWTEVLQLMKEGDKWMVYVPSELGYADRGAGAAIPPYSILIFELELIKVN